MRRPLIGQGEDFQASIGQREQVQGGVMGGLPRRDVVCVFKGTQGNERGEGVCERRH